jgi:hypothetical protein
MESFTVHVKNSPSHLHAMATIIAASSTSSSSSSVTQPATKEHQDAYMLDENPGELSRLSDLHDLTKATMGGLVLAPVDFSQPGLRILDSGTADGLSSSAGVDIL